jgi:DNA/RNA-binding protein KIN17
MVKAEKGSAKDLANKAKAKGLQKLQYYCQLCEKQCRDANGFKCHQTSASHLRMMAILREDPNSVVNNFSEEFEKNFLENLRRRHGVKRVAANSVYQEMIADKTHVHMNATQWTSLTVFVQYLGKKGLCIVEETEGKWFVQYIERDASKEAKAEAMRERLQAEKDEEERAQRKIEKQIREAARANGGDVVTQTTKLLRKDDSEKITVKVGAVVGAKRKLVSMSMSGSDDAASNPSEAKNEAKNEAKSEAKKPATSAPNAPKNAPKLSALDQIMLENENRKKAAEAAEASAEAAAQAKLDEEAALKKKEKTNKRQDYWLHRDIVVKIKNKSLGGGKFYKQKGVVLNVVEKYGAEVKVIGGDEVVVFDQDDLETVVGSTGGRVLICNGYGRGEKCELLEIKIDDFCGVLKVLETGEVLDKVEYEDFSKLHES